MNIELLRSFTGGRYDLPFVGMTSGCTYATDGRIAIRVNAANLPGDNHVFDYHSPPHSLALLMSSVDEIISGYASFPQVDLPEILGVISVCPCCNMEHLTACRDNSLKAWSFVGGIAFNDYYLAMIRQLDTNRRYLHPGVSGLPGPMLIFSFKEGIGVLMSMITPDEQPPEKRLPKPSLMNYHHTQLTTPMKKSAAHTTQQRRLNLS